MNRVFLSFSLAVAVILSGCGSSTSGPSGPVDYYPLAVGNWWITEATGYVVFGGDTVTLTATNDQSVIGSTTHAQGFDLWEIEQIMQMTFVHPDSTWTDTDTSYAYVAESDSEIVSYEDTITLDHEILLKLPATVGEVWNPYTDEPDITREVMSISVSVSVPAGSFTGCIHLRDTDPMAPDDEYDMWGAPDVGPCRVLADSAGIIHVEGELQSYVVNN